MKLQTKLYQDYEKELPQKGNFILGQEIEDSIYVYQAFNHSIANYAMANQAFGGNAYSFERMSWIKPNFLWMMYRAGWAGKENQERILAIKMKKRGFIDLLKNGVYANYQPALYKTQENWKSQLKTSEVRIQWDPDHNPSGAKLERRAVQIGIRGAMLQKFNNEFINEIIDLTDFVKEQHQNFISNKEEFLVIEEQVIDVPQIIKSKYKIGGV